MIWGLEWSFMAFLRQLVLCIHRRWLLLLKRRSATHTATRCRTPGGVAGQLAAVASAWVRPKSDFVKFQFFRQASPLQQKEVNKSSTS